MHKIVALVVTLACGTVGVFGQAKVVTQDPITGLPVAPATVVFAELGNSPNPLPSSPVCKSKMQGDFYSLSKIKTSAVAAWYAAHLAGFKKTDGYGSGRAQIAFSNTDNTLLVIVTGEPGAQGQDVDAYSVAYEKYTPGLSPKTIDGLTQGKMVCG